MLKLNSQSHNIMSAVEPFQILLDTERLASWQLVVTDCEFAGYQEWPKSCL